MNDDVALFGIGLHLDGAQNAAARVRTVTGVDIHVQRAKATGLRTARIPRCSQERAAFYKA